MAKPKKDPPIPVRFTPEERQRIQRATEKSGLSLSEQVRHWALLGEELDEAMRAKLREIIQEKTDSL